MKRSVFAIWVFFNACSTQEPLPAPTVADYLFLHTGDYRIYEVDSVYINQNVETEYLYQLRTEVIDSFPAAGGGYTWLIQRAWRTGPTAAWKSMASWSVRIDPFQAVATVDNTAYVWLAGPLTDGKLWNGNAYNTLGGTERCASSQSPTCDSYTLLDYTKPFQIPGGASYANTLTVLENDNNDLIVALDQRKSVYAKEVGLIYRQVVQLDYCTSTPSCLGEQFIEKGIRYTMRLVEKGG